MRRLVPVIIFILFAVIYHFGQTREGVIRIAPPQNGSKPYHYYPFEVPAKAESVEIEYSYDKKGGANVIDLGVFDSGFDTTERTLRGFRGWSGGRRNKIFIAQNSATNGYVPGKIPSGKWYVILGLYKVVSEGVEVTIKVRLNQIDPTLLEQKSRESEIKKFFRL